MANITQGGFRPWGSLSGGEGHFGNPFVQEVANNYGTQLSKYDIIIGVSDGTVAIGAAANNGLLLGVIIGCSYVVSGKRTPSDFIPASTTFTPTTVGSPNASLVQYLPLTGDLVLEVDADEATTFSTYATALGAIGENADIASPGSPSTVIGVSTQCLDISTHATTTLNFRMLGVQGYTLESGPVTGAPWNDPTVTRFKYLVLCNEGLLPPYTTSGV
jgi:hypothetical protein